MLGSHLLLTASGCAHPCWKASWGKGSKPQWHPTRAGDISAGRMLRSFPQPTKALCPCPTAAYCGPEWGTRGCGSGRQCCLISNAAGNAVPPFC